MSDKQVMVVALYPLPFADSPPVCLGIRLGSTSDVVRLKRLLVKQIRSRYDNLFASMKPKEIEQACKFNVYSTTPDKRGFPVYIGEAYWYEYNG